MFIVFTQISMMRVIISKGSKFRQTFFPRRVYTKIETDRTTLLYLIFLSLIWPDITATFLCKC